MDNKIKFDSVESFIDFFASEYAKDFDTWESVTSDSFNDTLQLVRDYFPNADPDEVNEIKYKLELSAREIVIHKSK